jgi:regulatory protein
VSREEGEGSQLRRGGRPARGRRPPLAVRRAERAEIADPAIVLEAALRFLEARQRSADEVRRRLLLQGYRLTMVDGAIARLLELGMLDDATFARAWVESRDRARPRGERALRQELRAKGIERSIIDQVISEREPDAEDGLDPDREEHSDGAVTLAGADDAAARRLLARHARALELVADVRARRQRAYALLARNGFDSETATSAIAAVLAE